MEREKIVYIDNSATTKLSVEVLREMEKYFTEIYGNASSQHAIGRRAMLGIDEARDEIAKIINASPEDIYFTSGGTEADNWALKGVFDGGGKNFLISSVEHLAVLDTAQDLEKKGAKITYIPSNEKGIIEPSAVNKIITDDTDLVCVMHVNNELGTINDIKAIAEIAHRHGALVFSDCVQSMPYLKIDVKELGVDMLSFSAHKFHGPKGVGVLYIKNGVKLARLISGGHQQKTRRGGTYNVPSIVGLKTALEICERDKEKNNAKLKLLAEKFINGLKEKIPCAHVNGDTEDKIPNIINVTFDGILNETLTFALDLRGICVSSGSACSAGSLIPSHVLKAIGLTDSQSKSSIRFSFGTENTEEEIEYCLQVLQEEIEKLK